MTQEPDPLLEQFAAQRASAPTEKRPLKDEERDALFEMYGVTPLLESLLKAGLG